MLGVFGVLVAAGGVLTRTLGLTGSHESWNDGLDTSCLAGYGLMIDAEKKAPVQARLEAEAKAEKDWITLLNGVNIPVAFILDVNDYVLAKQKILVVREQIARRGSVTSVLRQRLVHGQTVAQSLADYGELSTYLHVCGREAVQLE